MAAIVVETPPAAEPILLADAKQFLRVDIIDDDSLIADLIIAAREKVEADTGLSLVNKGFRQSLDSFPYFVDTIMSQLAYPPSYYSLPRYSTTLWNYSQMIKLLRTPLRAVTRITYTDPSNALQSLMAALPNWQALAEFAFGDQIEDSNGNVEQVTTANENEDAGASLSGAAQPTWATGQGQTTTDGDLVWTNLGPAPSPSFLFDRDSQPPRIFPVPGGFWPPVLYVPNAAQIHFVAGYGADGRNIPARARVALRQLIAFWYEHRGDDDAMLAEPKSYENLIWSIRPLDFAPTRG